METMIYTDNNTGEKKTAKLFDTCFKCKNKNCCIIDTQDGEKVNFTYEIIGETEDIIFMYMRCSRKIPFSDFSLGLE